jgi:hypothetical protein
MHTRLAQLNENQPHGPNIANLRNTGSVLGTWAVRPLINFANTQ